MRWERLFADLEARFDAQERADADGELSDLIRAERAALALTDRLRAHLGQPLGWSLGAGTSVVRGDLIDLGADWILIKAGRDELVIPLAALQFVEGLSRAATLDPREVARRWGLGPMLRGLARDRAGVEVRLRGGDGFTGTIDRVGSDHLDLALHPLDAPRRVEAVLGLRSVPIPAIVSIAVR